MRKLAMILIALLAATTIAGATSITLTPVADGKGTIGADSDFKVFNSTIDITNGNATFTLNFNFFSNNLNDSEHFNNQIWLSAADLLFQVGTGASTQYYGITISDRLGANTAGTLYKTTAGFQTAQTVLSASGNPNGLSYRNGAYVWLDGTLGTSLTSVQKLGESVSYTSGGNPEFKVTITGALDPTFLNLLNNNTTQIYFASATCGNGYESGTLQPGSYGPPPSVPEPASLVLLGSGLLGAGGVLRRKVKGN